MTPSDVVRAVLEFDSPPRIGFRLPPPYPNDFISAGRVERAPVELEPRGNEVRRWRDEWGVTWAALTHFDKGEVVEGAIQDWSCLDSYEPPDLGRREDYAEAARVFASERQRFRLGSLPGFTFNIARKIRKLEHYLCDLRLEPERISRLHDIVRAQLLKAIDRLAEAGADGIVFCEDWGTQQSLMVSPAMWREIFRPEFETLAGRAHEHGMYVFMHSCGRMTAIIGDLIECGVNCLLFDQPRLHGIERLGEEFGGRVAFCCPVDIQSTLLTRDREAIRAEARLLIEKLGSGGGGFIADNYGSPESIGITQEVQNIACEAFVEFGMDFHRKRRAQTFPSGATRHDG